MEKIIVIIIGDDGIEELGEMKITKKGKVKVKGWGFARYGVSDKLCHLHVLTDPNGKRWFGVRNMDIDQFKSFVINCIAKNNWGQPMAPMVKAVAHYGVDAFKWETIQSNMPRDIAVAMKANAIDMARENGEELYNR